MASSVANSKYLTPISLPKIEGLVKSIRITPVKTYNPLFYQADGKIQTCWSVMVNCLNNQTEGKHKFDVHLTFPVGTSKPDWTKAAEQMIKAHITVLSRLTKDQADNQLVPSYLNAFGLDPKTYSTLQCYTVISQSQKS